MSELSLDVLHAAILSLSHSPSCIWTGSCRRCSAATRRMKKVKEKVRIKIKTVRRLKHVDWWLSHWMSKSEFSPQACLCYRWSHTRSTAATPEGLDAWQRDGKAQWRQNAGKYTFQPPLDEPWIQAYSRFEVQQERHRRTPSDHRVSVLLQKNNDFNQGWS